jgi:hypothetical protein
MSVPVLEWMLMCGVKETAVQALAPPAPHPSSRANPCPEVTDPFCRIPLATFFYRPEAIHLGDLMRFGYALLCGQSPGV